MQRHAAQRLHQECAESALPAGNVIVDACYMDTFSFSDFDMHLPSTVPVSEVARQASMVPSGFCLKERPAHCHGSMAKLPAVVLCRFEIDQQAGTSRKTTLLAHSADFPQINPAFQGSPSYK